ncbi:hypothetical protein M9435_001495 [Picochlorum sp. BPE23]|nr:hypothetical protein M9435_001495 [Picochlorum sp. BPE23]
MVRVSIVVLALVVLAGHHAYGQEESSRLGFGKQMSKDLIESTLLLKAQVLNNTNRIHVLQSRIPANTARTETLQELADENTNTINDQFGLLGDLNNTIFSVMDRIRDEVTFPSVGDTFEAVINQVIQISDIDASLSNLRRRLMQDDEGRVLAPIAIQTAKKCGEELAALAAAIIKNNATISSLETAFDGNEIDIATLEATVTANEANLAVLRNVTKEMRDQLELRQVLLSAGTLRTIFFQNATGVTATEAINNLLNVSSIISTTDVAPGSRLPYNNSGIDDIVASCPNGWRLLSGSCRINYQTGGNLEDLQVLFVDGPATGATQLATFPSLTIREDYTDSTVTCVPDVVAAGGSSATPTTNESYWSADAPFSLEYTAEALCFEDLPEITSLVDYAGIGENLLIPPWVTPLPIV